MADKEKVIKGLEYCIQGFSKCKICPYYAGLSERCLEKGLLPDALELLKNEPNAPTSPTYQRLIAIKDELETENKTLKEDVKEPRRLTGSLTNLCENLLRRISADERS